MKIRIPKVNSILLLGLFLSALKTFLVASAIIPYPESLDDVLTVVICLCFIMQILSQKYPLKTLITYMLVGSLALYSATQSEEMVIVFTCLTCMAIRGQDFNDVIRFLFHWEVIFFVLHTLYSIVSYLLFDTAMVVIGTGNEGTALCFGFRHRNQLAAYLFNLMLMWIWINYDRLNGKRILGCFVFSTVVFLLVKSRTSYFCSVICCVLLLMTLYWVNAKPIIIKIAMVICPVLCVFTLTCTSLYLTGNQFIQIIDQLLTHRIRLGAYGLVHYGTTMLGQYCASEVHWTETWGLTRHTFDNIYTYSFFNIGWTWLVLVAVSFFILAKKGNMKICYAIVAWSLYGIAEVVGMNGYMCFPVLLIGLLLDGRKQLDDAIQEI